MKVGDKVLIVHSFRGETTGTIDRETATQWVVGHQRYRKSDRQLIGGSDRFVSTSIREITQQDLDRIEHRKLAIMLSNTDFKKQTLETLKAIKEMLK